MLLPDLTARATPFRALHSSAVIPSDVPGLEFPPILRQELAQHPLFRRRKWKRPTYRMANFLECGILQEADEKTRKLFWQWMRKNERRIKPGDRTKLVEIAIWPDAEGTLRTLSELCEPRSQRVATVLQGFIWRPHEQVRRSRLISAGHRSRTSIRHAPSDQEVHGWQNDKLAEFSIGSFPDAANLRALKQFEDDLTVLIKDTGVARSLKAADMTLPALAQDGSIQERTGLVMPSRSVERITLPSRFLLSSKRNASTLDKLSPVLNKPTVSMLLDAFEEDGNNFGALQARLQVSVVR